ncbi:unnamed protein product, partial [marine sediment metagenome]
VAVTWTNTGTVATVDLHYSTDDFATETPLSVWEDGVGWVDAINFNNTNTATWRIPDDISHTVKVRVKDYLDDDAYDISGELRIKGDITITAPILHEPPEENDPPWKIGQSYDITWGWIGTIDDVKVTYATKDGYFAGTVDVAKDSQIITGTGTFWLANISAGDEIGIGSTGPPSITKWYEIASVDTNTQITLTTYYKESDATGQSYCIAEWKPVEGDGVMSNTGAYPWTIPDEASPNAGVRIADVRAEEIQDVMAVSEKFHIIGYVK